MPRAKGEGDGGAAEDPSEAAAGAYGAGGFLRPEALDQARIEDLIRQHLGAGALEVLPDEELGVALHAFVEKDDKVGTRKGAVRAVGCRGSVHHMNDKMP